MYILTDWVIEASSMGTGIEGNHNRAGLRTSAGVSWIVGRMPRTSNGLGSQRDILRRKGAEL